MKTIFIIGIICFVFSACTDQTSVVHQPEDGSQTEQLAGEDFSESEDVEESQLKAFVSKKKGNVEFTVHLISGLDFYKKRNQPISSKDSIELEKETVALLEIKSLDSKKGIWDLPQLQLTKEDAATYLVGSILEDVSARSMKETMQPYGVNYEHQYGSGDKIKVFFFFGAMPKEKIKELVLYDRLFASGMMHFKMK